MKDLAILKQETVDAISKRVNILEKQGEIHLPVGYSAANALKSAWLILQEVTDKDGKLAIEACTKESTMNALFDMCIQGLNPAKKQCYFVAFGKKMVLMRSYFGSMAVAKMVDPSIDDIYAEIIYEGDTFSYEIRRGNKYVTEHKQQLGNLIKSKIAGAYAEIIDMGGNAKRTEIMSFDEIQQSWKQSKMNPFDNNGNLKPNTTHSKFTADMCKRTVINKVCKPIINSSSDNQLLQAAINRAQDEMAEQSAQAEIDEYANSEVIDIEFEQMSTQSKAGGIENDPNPAKKEAPTPPVQETKQGGNGETQQPDF